MRKGRFSKTEISFITENHDSLSHQEIAQKLNRDADSIKNFIKSKLGESLEDKKRIQALYDLKNRPYWRDLQDQFNEHELEMLLYHWGRIIGQFRDDVLPTEELQVLDAIKLEVLMNRALKNQQTNMEDVGRFEELITEEKGRPVEYQDRDFIFNLERQIAVARAAQEALGRDYKDLQVKKSGMLKDLKATREQRVKRLEDSKQTFISWVQNLMTNPDVRQEIGIEKEKMRLSVEKERKRLSEWHQYEDKLVDQPFLTPDSVKDE